MVPSKGSLRKDFRCFSLRKDSEKKDGEVIHIGFIVFTRIFFLRSLVTLFLVITIVLVSTFAMITLSDLQQDLYESQYSSYSNQALNTAYSAAKRASDGAKAVATQMSTAFPDAAKWPFVALNNYEENMQIAQRVSGGIETAFVPLVKPSQLSQFNSFMSEYFASEPNLQLPPTALYSVFGQVFRANLNPTSPFGVSYEVESDGQTFWGSPFTEIFPMLQVPDFSDELIERGLGFNLHSLPPYGPAIDSVVRCVRAASPAQLEARAVECGAMSDIITTLQDKANTVIVQPVYPANNRTTLSGITITGINWINVLTGLVPSSVSGLDFVVESPTSRVRAATYTIQDGVPVLRGVGDLHDEDFNSFARTRELTLPDSLSSISNKYKITMYPRQEFKSEYVTDLPRDTTIAAVLLICLTSVAFLVYDYFMKRDSSEKTDLLLTKRKFVRFISHEVRTPLNAVAMGLKLLENEFQKAIDDILSEIIAGPTAGEDSCDKNDTDGDLDADMVERQGCRSDPVEDFSQPVSSSLSSNAASVFASSSATASISVSASSILKVRRRMMDNHRRQIEDWRQLSVDITENTASAVFVLDDLLNYDKIETGSLRLELREVDIWELLRKTVHTFDLAAKQAKVSLVLRVQRVHEHDTTNTSVSGTPLTALPENVESADLAAQNGSLVRRSTDYAGSAASTAQLLSAMEEGTRAEPAAGSRSAAGPGSGNGAGSPAEFDVLDLFQRKGSVVNVLGDVTRLAQVIRNLVSNALKFTPEAGSVTIAAEWVRDAEDNSMRAPREMVREVFEIAHPRAAGCLCFSVTDTGAGLSEDQLANICSEGVQFNANELQGGRGSGLGLYITKGIVEQHGGTMVVTSEGLSKGTTFTVKLPLYLFPPAAELSIAASPEASPSGSTSADAGRTELGIHNNSSVGEQSSLPGAPDAETHQLGFPAGTSSEPEVGKARSLSSVPAGVQRPSPLYVQGSASVGASGPAPVPVPEYPPNVLVVDDAPSNRKMMMRLLKGKGCVCTEARDGQEALDTFRLTMRARAVAAGSKTERGLIRQTSATLAHSASSVSSALSGIGAIFTGSSSPITGKGKQRESEDRHKRLEESEDIGGISAPGSPFAVGRSSVGKEKPEEREDGGVQVAGLPSVDGHEIKADVRSVPAKVARQLGAENPTALNQHAADEEKEEREEEGAKVLEDFDAIFMDFEMPVLNGPDATKLIREAGCRCFIVGITGNVLPADLKHFKDQGADVVLPKPLQLEEVSRAWQEHIRRHHTH